MPIATLSEVLQPALKGSYAVGGLVTLGWEDMRAFVAAAEAENCSVILQAGPGCREHTPLPILGKMFRYLAENASVPVVAHLDHGYTYDECALALDSGFTSLMYDGSRKSLKVNIEETKRIVKMAHSSDISCEGEIGFVGYSNGEKSAGTDPTEVFSQVIRFKGVYTTTYRNAVKRDKNPVSKLILNTNKRLPPIIIITPKIITFKGEIRPAGNGLFFVLSMRLSELRSK